MKIQQYLENWKNESSDVGSRNFERLPDSDLDGEEKYLLTIKAVLNIGGKKILIENKEEFQTRVQSNYGDESGILQGDIHNCSSLIKKLEKEFKEKCDSIINKF